VLLEKAVSGYDAVSSRNPLLDTEEMSTRMSLSDDVKKPMRKSRLFADPRPPPPAPPPVSGLDVVILLDLSDEECLLRAADCQQS